MNFSRLSSAINSFLAASKRCNATSDPGWYCADPSRRVLQRHHSRDCCPTFCPRHCSFRFILPMKFQREKEQTAILHHLDRLHWRVWCTLAEQNLDRVVAGTWVCIVRRQFARIPFPLTPRDAARWRHWSPRLRGTGEMWPRPEASPAEATPPHSAD